MSDVLARDLSEGDVFTFRGVRYTVRAVRSHRWVDLTVWEHGATVETVLPLNYSEHVWREDEK